MAIQKQKKIKSFDKITDELKEEIAKQYPQGYASELVMLPKPDGSLMKVLRVETEDTEWLIKFPMEAAVEDDQDDLGGGDDELNLEGGEDVEEEEEKDEVEKPMDNFDDIDVADESSEV